MDEGGGSVGNNGCMCNNRGPGDDGGMGNNGGVCNNRVGRNGDSRSLTVGWNTLIGHLSDLTTVAVGYVVVDVLDSAVGQSHPVGSGG